MRSYIIKLIGTLFCTLVLFSCTAREAFAIPAITGKVVLAGTGAALPNVWVKWIEDFGTPYQSAYRYAQTDSNGVYTFEDLSTLPPGQLNNLLNNRIDTNGDGLNDDVQVFVDTTKPIPNASTGASALFHFNAANSPHSFTAVLPSGLSGTFNTISNVIINDADSSKTLSDIIFTPNVAGPTATPAPNLSISGNVFNDGNKNGNKDLGEKGFSGATIILSGASSATTTSDSRGDYSFPNLYAGSYTVAIVSPVGYTVTTASSSNINLTGNQRGVDFGLGKVSVGTGCTASITGKVVNDINWNGKLDNGETGIANWTVNLSSANLPAPISITTDSTGVYKFSNLCTDTFTLTQTILPPWFSTQSLSIVVNVNDGNAYTNINFYVAQKFGISGKAFLDPNGDGILTGGESGFKGVTVILIGTVASGPLFRQAVTAADGSYSFANLPVGTYLLLFSKVNNYRSTTANALNIDLSKNQIINYGLTPSSTIKIGGACSNTTLDLMLVMDISWSMNDPDLASGRRKLDEAKDAANAFIDLVFQNLPTARIGLVFFASSDDFNINNTGPTYLSSLMSDPTNNASALHSDVDNIKMNLGTCHNCGVKLANKSLAANTRPNSQKMVVFLTDGLANQIADDPGTWVSKLTAENAAIADVIDGVNSQNIIYNAIGQGAPGTDANNIDEDFLKAIANTNGGLYFNDPTNGNLQQIFQEIVAKTIPTGAITGMIYEDKDLSSSLTTGDTPIANMPVALSGSNLVKNLTTTSDGNGNYGFYGLCSSNGKNYTVSESTIPPWLLTTVGSYSIFVNNGVTYKNNNFGNRYGYSVSGTVFNDINKNQLLDAGEKGITSGITITSSQGSVTTKPDGTYSVVGILPGTADISYTSPLPKGYITVYPKNGPPPFFLATLGPACSVDGTTGGTCDNKGNITGLNFAISNSIPWLQTYGLDVRFDNGLTDTLPASTACGGGSYASGTNASFSSPGIIFSGDSSSDFGQGSASNNRWVVGGISYPEVFSNSTGLKTSTQNLIASAQKAGIDIQSLDSFAPCKNPATSCNLQGLPKGFYHTTGDLRIDSSANFPNNNYVIVADGTITITKGIKITVNSGATALFAAGKDINIDSSIHAASNTCPVPAGELQGIFSADRNISILGNNGNCISGVDTMLNIDGSLIVNAGNLSGKFQNQRDLCGGNPSFPSLTINARPDFILNTPGFLTQQQTISHEETP